MIARSSRRLVITTHASKGGHVRKDAVARPVLSEPLLLRPIPTIQPIAPQYSSTL